MKISPKNYAHLTKVILPSLTQVCNLNELTLPAKEAICINLITKPLKEFLGYGAFRELANDGVTYPEWLIETIENRDLWEVAGKQKLALTMKLQFTNSSRQYLIDELITELLIGEVELMFKNSDKTPDDVKLYRRATRAAQTYLAKRFERFTGEPIAQKRK